MAITVKQNTGICVRTVAATVDISVKADKVAEATENNFAALDETGNLIDSGNSAASFAASDITVTDIGGVASDDSRLTDSRTPTAHAASHKTGQADALTATDIGGVASNDSRLSDSRTPTAHAASHGTGQADAISIASTQVSGLGSAATYDAKSFLPNNSFSTGGRFPQPIVSITTAAVTQYRVYFIWVYIPTLIVSPVWSVEITSGSSGNIQMGLFTADLVSKLWDSGNIGVSVAIKQFTDTNGNRLGWYAFAVWSDSTPTMRVAAYPAYYQKGISKTTTLANSTGCMGGNWGGGISGFSSTPNISLYNQAVYISGNAPYVTIDA